MMEWRTTVEKTHRSATLVLSNETVPAKTERWLPLQLTRHDLAPKAGVGIWVVMATAMVTQRKSNVRVPLFGLEVALVLVKMQMTTLPMANVWMLTMGIPDHDGWCGLARGLALRPGAGLVTRLVSVAFCEAFCVASCRCW